MPSSSDSSSNYPDPALHHTLTRPSMKSAEDLEITGVTTQSSSGLADGREQGAGWSEEGGGSTEVAPGLQASPLFKP